jgi:4,5-dihydroxyphthalate decarboxylase
VRDLSFDVAELPIITFLIARDHGVALDLVPAVLLARYPFPHLVQRQDHPPLAPRDLASRRVAIRSYSVTTVTHVRDVLMHDFGLSANSVGWVSTEPPHVSDFAEPAFVERAPTGTNPASLLGSGTVAVAILGGKTVDPSYAPVFEDIEGLTASWQTRSGGSAPLNHLVAVKSEFTAQHPEAVREVFRMLKAANDAALATDPSLAAFHPAGTAQCRAGIEHAIRMAREQGLIRRNFELDELVADSLLDT